MRSRLYCLGVVAALLLLSTGCTAVQTVLYEPFGPGSLCDPTHCGPAGCGPAIAAPDACSTCGATAAVPCESCGECDGPCAARACGPCGRPWGPLSWFFDIFFAGYCGDGCGELYWSDFHSEPPDCCDPCDRLGNWTGGSVPASVTLPPTGCPSCGHAASQVRSVPQAARVARRPMVPPRSGKPTSRQLRAARRLPSAVQRSTAGSVQ